MLTFLQWEIFNILNIALKLRASDRETIFMVRGQIDL